MDTIDASIHSSLNNLQDTEQHNAYCYCGSLHAGDSGIESVQASPSPNAVITFQLGESAEIAVSLKDNVPKDPATTIGEATPLLRAPTVSSNAVDTTAMSGSTTVMADVKGADVKTTPTHLPKPKRMSHDNSNIANDLDYRRKNHALLHPDHVRLFTMSGVTKQR